MEVRGNRVFSGLVALGLLAIATGSIHAQPAPLAAIIQVAFTAKGTATVQGPDNGGSPVRQAFRFNDKNHQCRNSVSCHGRWRTDLPGRLATRI